MASKFVNLEEAADRLGLTKDRLNQLRESGQARAFRDGASWKFKEEEIERLAAEGVSDEQGEFGAGIIEDLELTPEAAEDDDQGNLADAEEVDLILDDDDALTLDDNGTLEAHSDLNLETDSDLSLDDEEIHIGGESNVLSAASGGSDVLDEGFSEADSRFENLEELASDLDLESTEDGSEAEVPEAAGDEDPAERDSEQADPTGHTPTGDSSIVLADDEDDEMVLGEGSGSDITLTGEQSGISLTDASDTGISLDKAPLELGGSAAESLDLDADDTFTLSGLSDLASESGVDVGEDIVISPTEGGSATSDSEVIAFDLEEEVDENSATILGSKPALGSGIDVASEEVSPTMLEEDVGDVYATDMEVIAPPAAARGMSATASTVHEAPYSVWNIVFLTLCVMFLFLSGIMMFDLMRNMWSWNEPYDLSSSLMDAILSIISR